MIANRWSRGITSCNSSSLLAAASVYWIDNVADARATTPDATASVESARRIPRDLPDELAAAGCFRVLTPTSHGGLDADLPTGMRTGTPMRA
jgi:hypothetical protein